MKDKNENKSAELNGDALKKVNAGLNIGFDESDYDIVYKKDDDEWKPDEPTRPGTYKVKIKSDN